MENATEKQVRYEASLPRTTMGYYVPTVFAETEDTPYRDGTRLVVAKAKKTNAYGPARVRALKLAKSVGRRLGVTVLTDNI